MANSVRERVISPDGQRDAAQVTIPVIEEHAEVGKQRVETGAVRLVKTVEERDETIDTTGFAEHYDVERVAVNRNIDSPVGIRHEGDTIIVPVLEEVVVVHKQLVLKEELRLTKRATEIPGSETVRLRKENVKVERITPA
jgi:uncharacterized protein (TIGR02271 family)